LYSDDADHVSSIWIKELVMNLLDPELKKQVYERYSKLMEVYQQGGITFFNITMDTVFKMSIMAEESLMSFIKDFGKKPRYQVRMCASFPARSMELLSG
jgi:isocitrate dehydrogenase kinase/phosphatase